MRFAPSFALFIGIVAAVPAGAQPTQTGAQPAAPRAPQVLTVVVRDMSGTAVAGVTVTVAGVSTAAGETDASGVARVTLPDGSHRLRLEREGFIGLEREVTLKRGAPAEVQVALRRAALPPPVEAPPPPPVAAAPPPPPPVPVTPRPAVGISVLNFLEENFVGRAPLKESVLGCTDDSMTRLLQLRDPIAEHAHEKLDEVLYVVAGEGVIQMGSRQVEVTAGWLSVVPRGVRHKMDRRGKNPLIVLSTLAGAPCTVDPVSVTSGRE